MYHKEIKDLKSLKFKVASTEDILNKSVYVANVSKYGENKSCTVYDPRSGALFNKRCETCKKFEDQCTGHFGHIELATTIVHPIFFKDVYNILRILCHSCSKLILSYDHIKFGSILLFSGEKRLNEIINKTKKFKKCFHCETPRREYKIKKDVLENSIQYSYLENQEVFDIYDDEIKSIFDDIDEESLKILKMSHPKNMCLEVFPVLPPCCRPYDYVGNVIKEDDLTKQLVEIIKSNNNLANFLSSSEIKEEKTKLELINNLKYKIESFCRTPKKKSKCVNVEPINSIRERLTGKAGQLRENLMGKRTEMSSRTVIGPGPHLKIDEVGIPLEVANNITFPIDVYENNKEEIEQMIIDGQVEKIKRNDKIIHTDMKRYSEVYKVLKIGDIVIRNNQQIKITNKKFHFEEGDRILRDGEDVTPEELPKVNPPDVKIGDIAQRKIKNGDWVLMNRQPTLWKGSMMAFKVVISTYGSKTFMFNLAVCKAFNSDFDGDEQNAHFPQSIESAIELSLLSSPKECILSSTNGTPIIVILQDALLGAYLMSLENSIVVDSGVYNDIIETICREPDDFKKLTERKTQIRKTLKQLGIYKSEESLRTGRAILSLIFPKDFCLENEDIKILDGVICGGFLSKKQLGSSSNSLIYMLKTEYNVDVCANFINDIQFMTNKWLEYNSFSVNMSDCSQNSGVNEIIKSKLEEAEFMSETILNPLLKEAKINILLSNAKDVGMKIAEDSVENNNIVKTITAGSKGDYFNLGQVKGLVGQQLLNCGRIQEQLDNGKRTMVHYPKQNLSLSQKYEMKGFISNSFRSGLNPQEFFFHSMSGRQGVCDTAMTTFKSGYNMRKIIKNTEDIKIQNDGTVVDSNNNLYSDIYGDIGLNPETACNNIGRIIDRLNKTFEDN